MTPQADGAAQERERIEEALEGITFGRLYCTVCESYDHECGCTPSRSEVERSNAVSLMLAALLGAARDDAWLREYKRLRSALVLEVDRVSSKGDCSWEGIDAAERALDEWVMGAGAAPREQEPHPLDERTAAIRAAVDRNETLNRLATPEPPAPDYRWISDREIEEPPAPGETREDDCCENCGREFYDHDGRTLTCPPAAPTGEAARLAAHCEEDAESLSDIARDNDALDAGDCAHVAATLRAAARLLRGRTQSGVEG